AGVLYYPKSKCLTPVKREPLPAQREMDPGEQAFESPKEETGKQQGDGQSQKPSQKEVWGGRPMETGTIGHHRSSDAGRQHVCSTDRQAEPVRRSDGGHGGNFRCASLAIGQVILSDLFANRYDDALPANHGAQAEGQSDGDFYPQRDEARR